MYIKLLVLVSLLFAAIVSAIPNAVIYQSGIHQDKYGDFIQPDKYLLSIGLKQYHKGYNQLASVYFKKSSALGNSMAQRLVGLMYINGLGVEKNMLKGYAWLKVASQDKSKRSKELTQQVYRLIKEENLRQAEIEYNKINEDYGTMATFTRRSRWVRVQMLRMIGTHTGARVFAPLSFESPHRSSMYDQATRYIYEYNFGYVTTGEIIPVEETEDKE